MFITESLSTLVLVIIGGKTAHRPWENKLQ